MRFVHLITDAGKKNGINKRFPASSQTLLHQYKPGTLPAEVSDFTIRVTYMQNQ